MEANKMTTKQEIIDYIEYNLAGGDDDAFTAVETAIQMIKDLKPRVKKLEFDLRVRQPDGWVCNPFLTVLYSIDYDGISLFVAYVYSNAKIGEYRTKEEAENACQEHYEENILRALEDEWY